MGWGHYSVQKEHWSLYIGSTVCARQFFRVTHLLPWQKGIDSPHFSWASSKDTQQGHLIDSEQLNNYFARQRSSFPADSLEQPCVALKWFLWAWPMSAGPIKIIHSLSEPGSECALCALIGVTLFLNAGVHGFHFNKPVPANASSRIGFSINGPGSIDFNLKVECRHGEQDSWANLLHFNIVTNWILQIQPCNIQIF